MAVQKRPKPIQALLWIIFYLAVIDISIGLLLPYPNNPSNVAVSPLRRYFEYGRSVEGKLDRMTGHSDQESAPIVGAGWLGGKRFLERSNKHSGQTDVLVDVYGMSHVHLLGKAMSECDRNYVVRDVTAPGAPANWAFAAYQLEKDRHAADVVILGIMTDGVPLISSTAGTTMVFDMSYPYTYPRFILKGDEPCPIYPPFTTAAGYREYFYDDHKWAQYRQWLSKYDKFYAPLLFRRTVLDRSCLVRLLRRAYAETLRRSHIRAVYTDKGFNPNSEEAIVLKRIVTEFARSARRKNTIPVIYLVNTPGRSDHLFRLLKPVLDAENIPYLSTHIICPPDNPLIFLPENTHFIPKKDKELAEEMIKIIEKERKRYSELAVKRVAPRIPGG